MKMHSIKYLIGEGFSNAWANRLMSLASIGVLVACMVVIGLAVLITENVKMAIGNLEEQNVIMVYMKDYNWAKYSADDKDTSSKETSSEDKKDDKSDKKTDEKEEKSDEIDPDTYVIHNETEAKALCDKIAEISNVKDVEFISSEDGLAAIKETMTEGQEEYLSFVDNENPLSCAAKVTMKDMSIFENTINEIKKLDGVDVIQSQGDLAETITAIEKGIGIAGASIMAILIIISLVIVSNTIRVTMYNRKLEISIMKAVGATDSFVRIPFLVEGMAIGTISAILSEVLIYFCYRVATETIASTLGTTEIVKFGDMALVLFLIFFGVGVFAGIMGSALMISKYLRKEGSEFAAI